MDFKDRQKTKILKSIESEPKTYDQIHKNTGIKLSSVRGRLSEIRKKGLTVKKGDDLFKITDEGMEYLQNGNEV